LDMRLKLRQRVGASCKGWLAGDGGLQRLGHYLSVTVKLAHSPPQQPIQLTYMPHGRTNQ
jgi:hypothetical protein